MDSRTVGTVSEMVAMLEYAKRGYVINIPTDQARYDFIAEKEGRTVKVQVKHGTQFNGGRELLSFSKIPYRKIEIDVLVVYDSMHDNLFYIPTDHIEGMQSIRLRYESNDSEKTLNAEHYTKFIG